MPQLSSRCVLSIINHEKIRKENGDSEPYFQPSLQKDKEAR